MPSWTLRLGTKPAVHGGWPDLIANSGFLQRIVTLFVQTVTQHDAQHPVVAATEPGVFFPVCWQRNFGSSG
jgi:hypothetical protein